jgi:hypothetical protein
VNQYDLIIDPDYTYQEYSIPPPSLSVTNIAGDVSVVTTINGGGGGQATGPNVTFSGGATGLNFTASGNTITLSGTLAAASGGTGQSSYAKGDLLAASAATVLSKLTVGANNARLAADSATLTGLIWILASTGWGAASGTLSRAAYAAYAGQTVSNPPTQVEVQAIDDALKLLSETVAALITDLTAQKLLNP